MSKFVTPLSVTLLEGSDTGRACWRLNTPLIYEDSTGKIHAVPSDFETDFASVPRLPLAFMLCGDTAHRAAALHDYLYSRAELTRKEADELLLESMAAIGVPAWRRYAIYAAVRSCGWAYYKEQKGGVV